MEFKLTADDLIEDLAIHFDVEPLNFDEGWSLYDDWLVPILNRARYSGPIEFRALPSEIQLHIEKRDQARDQQIALAARIDEVNRAVQSHTDQGIPAQAPSAEGHGYLLFRKRPTDPMLRVAHLVTST